ncbi:MAG: acyl-CoA thioesterase [Ignavibacteriaceae bacterium]
MDIKNFKHSIKIKVRFSDLDAMRHVNNATYLSYLEEARIAYFKDVLNKPMEGLEFDAVVARIEIDYQQPIIFGDEIEILSRVSKMGNKSSDVEHLIIVNRKGNKIIAASVLTKLVAYDYTTLTSFPIPESVKNQIEKYENG